MVPKAANGTSLQEEKLLSQVTTLKLCQIYPLKKPSSHQNDSLWPLLKGK